MQHQKLIRIEYFKNTMTTNKPNENGIYVFISFNLKFSPKIVWIEEFTWTSTAKNHNSESLIYYAITSVSLGWLLAAL